MGGVENVDGCVKGRKSTGSRCNNSCLYIGPSLTEAVYRKGTIGRAKDDLEATAFTITDSLADINGKPMFL
jgi:trans-2-enoyl-CoA reductase